MSEVSSEVVLFQDNNSTQFGNLFYDAKNRSTVFYTNSCIVLAS